MSRFSAVPIVAFVLAACLSDCGVALAQDSTGGDIDQRISRALALRQHNRNGWEATLGLAYMGWADTREPWREPRLALRKNTKRGPLIARLSRIRRFAMDDDKLEVEAYPAFRGGYGSVAVGYASNGDLYPRSTVSAELFKTLPGQLEGSLGYRRLNFPNAVNILTGSFGSYVRDYLLGARVHRVSAGATGTATSLLIRRYLADDGRFVGVHAAAGSIREDIRTQADFDARSSRSIGVEALVIVRSRWLLTLRQAAGQDKMASGRSTGLSSVDVGIGARF